MTEDARPPLARTASAPGPRVTTAQRDRVIARLSDGFADGTLDVEEFERRVSLAHRSDVADELEALLTDLPGPIAASAPADTKAPAPLPSPARDLVPESQVKPSGTVLALLGGAERKGAWRVPRTLQVVTVMGGARLDLREARLPAGTIELRVATFMGGVEIIVPPHLAVEASGSGIMGGFAHVDRAPDEPDPAAPLLRITGLAVMGGVSIEMRLPGESERDARKRRKRERKALARRR